MYGVGLIGNCQISALVSAEGSIDWLCLPRPDSEPVFGRLLDPDGGRFSIELCGDGTGAEPAGTQRYLENTALLVTELSNGSSAVRITDFCPRFAQYGRMYRPATLFRIVEPIAGSPAVRVSCRPISGWGKEPVAAERGNSHIRYTRRDGVLRVVSNMSLTYLEHEQPYPLRNTLYFGVTWGVGIEDDLVQVAESFRTRTAEYWRTWVKHCSIPSLYQRETIRSALTLKLHCYEDTGAILAALTTSLPEEPGAQRNWDYRYCWFRDAYFALNAFHSLGHFEEMEAFLGYLLGIAHEAESTSTRLSPVYSLSGTRPLPESTHPAWNGFAASRPVRSNNAAADHLQHDVYGELILALAPIFFDERFHSLRTAEHQRLICRLATLCAENIGGADAGIWEIRDRWQEHSFSNLMCWAGLERVARIRTLGFLGELGIDPARERTRAEEAVRRAVRGGSLRNGPSDDSLDAALALLPILRFPDRELSNATLHAILHQLCADAADPHAGFYFRYRRRDDFGTPASCFLACSFWLVQGLALTGHVDVARSIMARASTAANELGLYSEHWAPGTREQRGNFPQAYSHVGQLNAAFALSPPWTEVL